MIKWARQHPIIAFLILGFGIPWVGWSTRAILFADQPLPRTDWPPGSWALYYTGCGLIVGAFVMSWITAGREGVADLFRRCIRWRVSLFWWMYALLLPIVFLLISRVIVAAAAGVELGGFQPWQIWRLITPGVLLIFTIGPLCEEAGWRGYLLPKLMADGHGALTASLLIGFMWTMWHFPLSFMPETYDQFHSPLGVGYYMLLVTCLSIHFSAIYLNGAQSVLLLMAIHWTVNASSNIVGGMFPEATSEALAQVDSVPWGSLVNLGLWVIATIVLVAVLGSGLRTGRDGADEVAVTDG